MGSQKQNSGIVIRSGSEAAPSADAAQAEADAQLAADEEFARQMQAKEDARARQRCVGVGVWAGGWVGVCMPVCCEGEGSGVRKGVVLGGSRSVCAPSLASPWPHPTLLPITQPQRRPSIPERPSPPAIRCPTPAGRAARPRAARGPRLTSRCPRRRLPMTTPHPRPTTRRRWVEWPGGWRAGVAKRLVRRCV